MSQAYAVWITTYEHEQGGQLLGKCRAATQAMAEAFPELKIVRGHVLDALWGRRGHWWLMDPAGEIVDPTAAQFPALMGYDPWEPGGLVVIGRCANCGELIERAVQTLDEPPPLENFCGAECEEETLAKLRASL